jgi:hypothetical protein
MKLFHFKAEDGYARFVIIHKNEEKARADIERVYGAFADLILVGSASATKGQGIRFDANKSGASNHWM